jgi:hypothetical protein
VQGNARGVSQLAADGLQALTAAILGNAPAAGSVQFLLVNVVCADSGEA